MSADRKDSLVEAVLEVLRLNPRFSKIEERNVKRILRKLDESDLTYLANTFDVFREFLEKKCSELFATFRESIQDESGE
uniref:Uncharacterized protein n=1 Tax=Thermofilum pendens TaxID=2269 RepID=A0A7C4BA36_THEPE